MRIFKAKKKFAAVFGGKTKFLKGINVFFGGNAELAKGIDLCGCMDDFAL